MYCVLLCKGPGFVVFWAYMFLVFYLRNRKHFLRVSIEL